MTQKQKKKYPHGKNPKSLANLQPHVLTQEDRIKGGQSKSETKKLALAVSNRIHCDAKCPIYEVCPGQFLSHSGEKQYKSTHKSAGRRPLCAVNQDKGRLKQLIMDYHVKGREGQYNAILNELILLDLQAKKEGTTKALKSSVDAKIKAYETFHKDAPRTQVNIGIVNAQKLLLKKFGIIEDGGNNET